MVPRLRGSLWKVPMSVQEARMAPRLRGSLWKVPMVAVTSVQEAMVLTGSAQEAKMAVSTQEAGLSPVLLGKRRLEDRWCWPVSGAHPERQGHPSQGS